jgi:hypothetical protein
MFPGFRKISDVNYRQNKNTFLVIFPTSLLLKTAPLRNNNKNCGRTRGTMGEPTNTV